MFLEGCGDLPLNVRADICFWAGDAFIERQGKDSLYGFLWYLDMINFSLPELHRVSLISGLVAGFFGCVSPPPCLSAQWYFLE